MITTGRITANTTAQLVYTASGKSTSIVLRKENDNGQVAIGDATVVVTNGFVLRGTDPVSFDLGNGDALYVVTASGSEQIIFIATT